MRGAGEGGAPTGLFWGAPSEQETPSLGYSQGLAQNPNIEQAQSMGFELMKLSRRPLPFICIVQVNIAGNFVPSPPLPFPPLPSPPLIHAPGPCPNCWTPYP